QLFRRWRAIGREAMQHGDDVGVTSHDPGVKERVPMHRIVFAKAPIERVRIGQNLGIEKLAQTELGLGHRASNCASMWPASSSLIASSRVITWRSISAESFATVCASNKW